MATLGNRSRYNEYPQLVRPGLLLKSNFLSIRHAVYYFAMKTLRIVLPLLLLTVGDIAGEATEPSGDADLCCELPGDDDEQSAGDTFTDLDYFTETFADEAANYVRRAYLEDVVYPVDESEFNALREAAGDETFLDPNFGRPWKRVTNKGSGYLNAERRAFNSDGGLFKLLTASNTLAMLG
jgi:hypothetical protein